MAVALDADPEDGVVAAAVEADQGVAHAHLVGAYGLLEHDEIGRRVEPLSKDGQSLEDVTRTALRLLLLVVGLLGGPVVVDDGGNGFDDVG
ncbi:hypothetical protein [Saccharothrix sp. Mg75]|uniref:hypothetical protein n=1 Tax=Saccharothrix sp. Mg75 TaxID=3445357 RepID=UPI003EECA292